MFTALAFIIQFEWSNNTLPVPASFSILTEPFGVSHHTESYTSSHSFLTSGAFSVSLKVTLPCLACLFIYTPLLTTVGLLSCIDSPLKTQVRLEIKSEDKSSINDYDLLPSLLAQRFSKSKDLSSTLAIHSLIISFSFGSEFTLSVSEHGDSNPDLSLLYPPQDCDISLMICFPMGHLITINNKVCVIGNICCSVPLCQNAYQVTFWSFQGCTCIPRFLKVIPMLPKFPESSCTSRTLETPFILSNVVYLAITYCWSLQACLHP